jgi:hypothetical protein
LSGISSKPGRNDTEVMIGTQFILPRDTCVDTPLLLVLIWITWVKAVTVGFLHWKVTIYPFIIGSIWWDMSFIFLTNLIL